MPIAMINLTYDASNASICVRRSIGQHDMATYEQIQSWVKQKHGFLPKSCWIAHCKELAGLPVRQSPRRYEAGVRQVPCPEDKQSAIFEAFDHFRMKHSP